MAEARVIWRPQPKQRAFMERPEYEALYGGAAGGGKSDANKFFDTCYEDGMIQDLAETYGVRDMLVPE